MYLGKNLSPRAYYEKHSAEYENPHADGIYEVLRRLHTHLEPRVLDLGCGRGLATKILREFGIGDVIGVDASKPMADRYERETIRASVITNFWDMLPHGRSAVACYSLHLCPASRVHEVVWRLREAGITRLVVVSPLKRAVTGLGLTELDNTYATSKNAGGKTVWGWAFEV